MRSRSNSGVRLDGYARLVQQTILCHQVGECATRRMPARPRGGRSSGIAACLGLDPSPSPF